jgi:hypothetical protein
MKFYRWLFGYSYQWEGFGRGLIKLIGALLIYVAQFGVIGAIGLALHNGLSPEISAVGGWSAFAIVLGILLGGLKA